jgi:23S rRNA (pseudouridine1915-N3)-methyltransferase
MKDHNIKSLCDDYIKRLSVPVHFIECTTKIKQNDSDDQIKQKQGDAILKQIEKFPTNTTFIALDERGKQLDSPSLAEKLSIYQTKGTSSFCFIIGGAFGLSQDILDKMDFKLSFGSMVWPHRLVGVMLLEQLYRAQQINAGHPYHKT